MKFWWHSTEESPEDGGPEQIHYELSADLETSLMDAEDVQALVAAWQMGAISRDTLLHNFRQGEILPPGRTTEQEVEKIRTEEGNPEFLQKITMIAKQKIAKDAKVLAHGHKAEQHGPTRTGTDRDSFWDAIDGSLENGTMVQRDASETG